MAKTKRQKSKQALTAPVAIAAGAVIAVGAAAAGLWRWQQSRGAASASESSDESLAGGVQDRSFTDSLVEGGTHPVALDRPVGEMMSYTGDRAPDMAVDYVPGDDPTSLDNEDTRQLENTIPPPLRAEG